MNVEFMAEAAQFPEKEYINGIAIAVRVGWALDSHQESRYSDHCLFQE
jgi:hypothetical protein